MPTDAPLEQRLITHADMRRMPDGATRLLGTELKRLSAWLYVLEPFNPGRHI